ncbi:ABC transporter permease subunit [Candidatus Enterococcus ferrettii]|uniref:ABC transmembrane type-1 domain-containing protein n=1 Tax=Candidatus Enterococcus ferrettii TaxID=2815324 RepID=A0ABV0EUP8_9ENTE|nr:ABC transporter permease [Enterococcus sp. 665A]
MKKLVKPILACFGLYYFLPIIGTILYASSTKWSKTILPSDFTLKWFQQLLTDGEFIAAVGRSILLAGVVLLTILVLMIPTIIWIHLYFPRLNRWLEKLVLLPYALPGVILVTALLRTYAKTGIPMFVVLVGALFVTALPIVFLSLNNQMRLINLKELVDAAETLGAPISTIVFRVLFPNIRIGATLVSLMIFSSVFGEYMLTNLLIGGRFQTVRIYMLRRMNENGHLASAVMVLYLLFMVGIALTTFMLTNRQKQRLTVKQSTEVKQSGNDDIKGVVTENVFRNT